MLFFFNRRSSSSSWTSQNVIRSSVKFITLSMFTRTLYAEYSSFKRSFYGVALIDFDLCSCSRENPFLILWNLKMCFSGLEVFKQIDEMSQNWWKSRTFLVKILIWTSRARNYEGVFISVLVSS